MSKLFYKNDLFRQCDLALKKAYLVHNPFTISKNFLKEKGEKEIDVYGEIPLTSLLKIAQECTLRACDHVLELGCGRGRAAFFLRGVLGCSVTAIDWVPFFILKAQEIVKAFDIERITFTCTNMNSIRLKGITCIYLYGTCLTKGAIVQMCSYFLLLPAPIKIITLSYPLELYHTQFKTIKQFNVSVPWGKIEVFLNQKVNI